jgi:hypothetical protein
MTAGAPDLERIKEKVIEGREAIRDARLILEDRELDEKHARIKSISTTRKTMPTSSST